MVDDQRRVDQMLEFQPHCYVHLSLYTRDTSISTITAVLCTNGKTCEHGWFIVDAWRIDLTVIFRVDMGRTHMDGS